ncbi:MAG: regulatory protein RecX [Steroidobacteraceae bacterium]
MGTLRRKRPVDPSQATAKDPEAARRAAIALLARRDFASGELRQKLGLQGYDASVAATVVTDLTAERALDDVRYAENYVMYHAERGQGPIRIASDLRALGVPNDLIEAALATGPDWRALARQVRVRKFGVEPPEEWIEKTRQARFLQYRGFSSDHIRAATGADFDPDS